MFNDSLFLLSLSEFKEFILMDLSLLGIAHTYIIVYVIYKAIGRYIYFKSEEHASKINRTFLFISVYIIVANFFGKYILWPLSFPIEYKWVYTLSVLVLVTGLLSMIFKRITHDNKFNRSKDWTHKFLPISSDSYKTTTRRSEEKGNYIDSWNDETVAYTDENLHSDMMLNFFALIIFIVTNIIWIINIQQINQIFFAVTCTISIVAIYIDRGIYKWMHILRWKIKKK